MKRRPEDDVIAHLPALTRYARALTRDDATAEDLVQEALLKAHEKRATFRTGTSLQAWLFAILRNAFISSWRQRRAENTRIDRLATLAPAEEAPSQEQAAYLRQIAQRFDALPTGQREVLHLIVVEELSYAETAAALSIPVGTVMSRLGRARARLRAESDPAAARLFRIVGGQDEE